MQEYVINIEKSGPAITDYHFSREAQSERIDENEKLHKDYLNLLCEQLNNMDNVYKQTGHYDNGSATNVLLGRIIMKYDFAYVKILDPIICINRTHYLRTKKQLVIFNPVGDINDAMELITAITKNHKECSLSYTKNVKNISDGKIKLTLKVKDPNTEWLKNIGKYSGTVTVFGSNYSEMICSAILKLLVKNNLYRIKTNKRKFASSEFKNYFQYHNHESKEAMLDYLMIQYNKS